MDSHEKYMNRCIQLAKLGQGNVAPNPMVGAVIVYQNKIIGEGYHKHFGGYHAEVNAINSVKDKSLLKKATIYVSLEPCAHSGKTPPCANLIVEHQFKKVVIGSHDPHSIVNGKGIFILKENNIEVISGVLKEECDALNKRFFTFHQKQRPYIVLKWAETLNGKIDNGESNNKVFKISCKESQVFVHQLRKENQAILVGKKTVENDNPSLTLRGIEGRNPTRIILDSNCSLSEDRVIFDNQSKTFILNKKKSSISDNNEWIKVKELSPSSILKVLHNKNIDSILIEGGKSTLQSFIEADFWDEAHVFIGKKEVKKGTNAPKMKHPPVSIEQYFDDQYLFYINKHTI